jgi:putative OPT family oligopeptide transporter
VKLEAVQATPSPTVRTRDDHAVELTVRGVIIGALITLVFTAANVYLGLKVGLTFASSIPAAVISMAVLRAFRGSTIYENNIVQTVASAAGTLSSIIFVLPGLVMVGWWTGFPFWESFGVCAAGGILGVMYSVPLRRAMVTTSDLPYPEGVAAAEVLIVGSGASSGEAEVENKAGLLTLVVASVASAVFAAIVATGVFAAEVAKYFRVGAGATGFGFSLSLALIGAGQLIGLAVGLAMFTGLVISWGFATPIISGLHPQAGAAAAVAADVWRHKVRFIGAGTIGIAAIWALIALARPVWNGVLSSLAASRKLNAVEEAALPIVERDIPIKLVGLISLACLVPVVILLVMFLSDHGAPLGSLVVPLVIGAVLYIVLAGFFVAAACGYMAGLIGSSNSPVSGLAILTVIGASLLLVLLAHNAGTNVAAALVAYSLIVTAVVLCIATISNDNLQDLKTGQLVGATPWRQQIALVIGVIFGALVIPPILNLLNVANGFAGAPNVSAAHASQALAAPQATLISALALGVIKGQIDWGLIGIGVLIGIAFIAVDEVLRRTGEGRKLPPLAVGLGIYLPVGTIATVVVGALIGSAYNRWVAKGPNAGLAKRLGVLLASGFIVGESLFGVALAAVVFKTGNQSPLALVGDAFANSALIVGALGFIAFLYALYMWTGRLARNQAL